MSRSVIETIEVTGSRLDSHSTNTTPLPPLSSPWPDAKAEHTVKKEFHLWRVDSKNFDRNGPEGQFMTASTTMCNAGSPPYGAMFMISAQSIKVSMKKKKDKKRARIGRGGHEFIGLGGWPVHACNLHKMQVVAERPVRR